MGISSTLLKQVRKCKTRFSAAEKAGFKPRMHLDAERTQPQQCCPMREPQLHVSPMGSSTRGTRVTPRGCVTHPGAAAAEALCDAFCILGLFSASHLAAVGARKAATSVCREAAESSGCRKSCRSNTKKGDLW